ncbi:hypothetical protein ABK905_00380 [Acerihabitans sp. KWT182]|uniref:Uncharacterized protein n=1 Tax=Acerihabitans sp. KWT182 TaxID=3157919 RepID=A0AAU7QB21_9GAMM
MIRAQFFLLIFCSFRCFPTEVIKDVRCFTSINKHINLKLTLLTDQEWSGGYVKYRHSSSSITIVPIEIKTDPPEDDRPAETKMVWSEIVNGDALGKYTAIYQGAIFSKFIYSDKK